MKTLAVTLALCIAAFGQVSAGGTGPVGGTITIQGGTPITVVSLAVTPSASPTLNVNQSLGLTATATLSDGSHPDVTTSAAWTSSNLAIASFVSLTATENIICNSAGTALFTAAYGNASGSIAVTCVGVLPPTPTPVSVAISPASPSTPQGTAVYMKATETYSDGSTLDVTASAVFVSGTTSVATIHELQPAKGREVSCNGTSGTSVITITNDGFSDHTTLTCTAVLSTITVSPATPSILAGSTQQFIATCNYSDGSSQACVNPTWASGTPATASVNANGLALGLAAGTSSISATIGAIGGNTLLTVSNPGPPPPMQTGTSVGPPNVTINVGQTLQYQGLEQFSDGSTVDCTSTATSWGSTTPATATITSAGLATAVAAGTTTIQVTCGGHTGSTGLTVQAIMPTLVSIAVTPASPTQYNGSVVQFTAIGTYSDSSQVDLTSVAGTVWTSATPAVATISANVATCIANSGNSVIKAAVGAVNGSQTLTCTAATNNTAVDSYCTSAGAWIGATVDGPATLPTACMNTNPTNNPSGGTVHGPYTTLSTLQAAINAGACGDVYTVTAGTDLGFGPLTLPHKGCDSAHWNTIQSTGVSNANFPAYGTRMTPCWAGVASLPNRPAYICPTPTNLMFKLSAATSNSAIKTAGADYWIIRGAEITRTTAAKALIYSVIDLSSSGTQTNHIIFDRDWIHGVNADGHFPQTTTTDTSTTRGIWLGQSNHIAVVNSYFSDFYDNGGVASNGNTDAQAIGGGVGSVQLSGWGVYKFVNNHLEGGSETIILGGANGPANTPSGCTFGSTCTLDVPADIEIRQNYMFKSLGWTSSTASGPGWPNVKNGMELKTGARVLIEGNVFENCWYNSQPYCYVIDYAPKNQVNVAGGPGTCPSCLVQDAVSRYNYGYNYPGPFLAVYSTNFVGGCTNCNTLGRRLVFHDNLVGDKLNRNPAAGLTGYDCIEFDADAGPMTDVSITHNTCVASYRSAYWFGGAAGFSIANVKFQDNLFSLGNYGFVSFGACGGTNTNFYTVLNSCAGSTWTADHNANFNWNSAYVGSTPLGKGYPTDGNGLGNWFYVGTSPVGFTNYGTGDSNLTPSNYALLTSSPLHNAGSDGKDIGADITALLGKVQNVPDPGHVISLMWTPSSTPGVVYNAYRGNATGGPYAPVGANIVNSWFYDKTVASQVPYFYIVRAYDGVQESSNSNEATATIP